MSVFLRSCLVIIPLILLTACGDRAEMDRLSYVVVIGLDESDDKHQLDVTLQIANPQVGSSERGQAQNEPPSTIVTLRAPDIVSAKEIANTNIPRQLNFGHMKIIVISEKLAQSPRIHHILAASMSDPEMRREVTVIVSKEKAADFIKNNLPKQETRPHKFYEFIRESWQNTGFVTDSTLNRYFERLRGELLLVVYGTSKIEPKDKENEDEYLAGEIPQKGGDPVQIMGSAVFKNGKMVGTLTGEETRLALFMRPKSTVTSAIASIPDPLHDQYRISVRYLKDEDTSVDIDVKQYPPKIDVTIPLKIQVLSVPSEEDYTNNAHNQERLRKSIQKGFEQKMKDLIKKAQEEFKGDPFNWHMVARKKFWTMQQYEQYNWVEKFTNAKVNIHLDIEIINFGKQYKVPKMKHR